ncbi:MAG: guanine deaminase [Gammaproteobacteria bacterium]|jgi:guanine deaminase
MSAFTISGTVIHAPVCGELEIKPGALVEVDESGQISAVHDSNSANYEAREKVALDSGSLIELTDTQYLLPGMIDLHIHAPQWPQSGGALHLPLYDWLQQCTFPLEAKYADIKFADKVYSSLVDTLIANGTTTALYFATVHLESSKLLADICHNKGQRGLVGKVAMDNPDECPDYYRDVSTEQGLKDTRALIEYIRAMSGNENERVMPVVTPRFIPSCTDEMLEGLGKIAKEYDCHVQTHCSESDWEHAYVIERHGVHDTTSLDNFGLLGNKTVLAHSNFINDEDMQTIKNRQTGIAHCPLSNFYFSNAVFPARKALDKGLDIGLGTDISGGPNPSLLHNCNTAVTASRALEEGVNPDLPPEKRGTQNSRINFKEAFWMATTGGGRALDLKIGLIKEGYAMDAIVVDTALADSNVIVWDELDGVEDVLQKIIYNANRSNISSVWVQGKQIK